MSAESIESFVKKACLICRRYREAFSLGVKRRIVAFPIAWKFAKALAFAAASMVLVMATTEPSGISLPFHSHVVSFVTHRPFIILALFALPAGLSFLFDFAESRSRARILELAPDKDEFSVITEAIERVVATKAARLRDFSDSLPQEPVPASRILEAIAKPEEQIAEIVSQLYYTFHEITRLPSGPSVELKVGLVRIVDKAPILRGAVFLPRDHPPPAEIFDNGSRTMFADVARARASKVIPDIAIHKLQPKLKRRGYFFMNGLADTGSILCVPIFGHSNEGEAPVIYVISFHSNITDIFTRQNLKKYEAIAGYFGRRILMEKTLASILDKTAQKNEALNPSTTG